MRKVLAHLRGNVVAYLALFLALGFGTAWAASLPKNSVGTKQIKNGQVKNRDIKPETVAGSRLKEGAVGGSEIRSDAVAGVDVAPDSLTGADIAEGSLTLPQQSVLPGQLAEQPHLFASSFDAESVPTGEYVALEDIEMIESFAPDGNRFTAQVAGIYLITIEAPGAATLFGLGPVGDYGGSYRSASQTRTMSVLVPLRVGDAIGVRNWQGISQNFSAAGGSPSVQLIAVRVGSISAAA